jgi:hypothetical protein
LVEADTFGVFFLKKKSYKDIFGVKIRVFGFFQLYNKVNNYENLSFLHDLPEATGPFFFGISRF